MFERFTEGAREVVVGAQEQSAKLRHREINADHLLLSLAARDDNPGSRVLRDLRVDYRTLADQLATLGRADAEALNAIGVDLSAVRESAEAAFGPGALDRPPRRRLGIFRRRAAAAVTGHIPFVPSAKQALEHSLREALALEHRHIGPEHILLGLLADDRAPAALTLQRLGVDPADVRRRVKDALRGAA
jgi:ATP-dependent Clp protease ATP-binding subunit ClpA